jgi:protoheme IX farnesyltransferase
MRPLLHGIRLLSELGRAKLSAAMTLSAATGFFMFREALTWEVLRPVLGVFWLACGASGLNQVQEVRSDARMERTRHRPLPAGRMSVPAGIFWSVLMILIGLYWLASVPRHRWFSLGLAVFALVWYNGVYTYLKRINAFAVLPGALLGAIPPLMGWSAAGGVWYDREILLLCVFFFVWQIPHFWLLMLRCGSEYESAGLGNVTRWFGREQFCRITFVWMIAAAVVGYWVALLNGAARVWVLADLISSGWLIWTSLYFLSGQPKPSKLQGAFLRSTVYAVLLMVILSLDALAKSGLSHSSR